jgi:hypothetical protein
MGRRVRKWLTAALVIGALSSSNAVAERKAQPRKVAPPAMTPAEYRAAVADVTSCADFDARAAELPSAVPLMVAALHNEGGTTKSEYETTAQFRERQAEFWSSHLGDPQHLVIRVPIDSYKVSYDADRGVSVVKYLVDWWSSYETVTFFNSSQSRGSYVGQNAFGVKVDVHSYKDLQARLRYTLNALGGSVGGPIGKQWEIPLAPSDAKAFAEKPSLVLFARLEPPYLEADSHYSEATIDEPTSLMLEYRTFPVKLLCGAFVSGAKTVVRTGLVATQ